MADKSPTIKYARQIVQGFLDRIDSDQCSEEELLYFIERTNAHANGYFKANDFANYDTAQRILDIKDRGTMKEFLDKHKVKMNKINNMPVGFFKCEVEALATKARKVFRKRKPK